MNSNIPLLKPRLIDSKPAHRALASRFGDDSGRILAEAGRLYPELAAELPYLGDEPHMNSLPMVEAAYFLALCRVLQSRGLTAEEAGKVYYEMLRSLLDALPGPLRWLYSRFKYNKAYIARYRAYAEETQKRRYPGDFVCRFVEGDGESFDYGYDYTECAILKYFQKHDAGEFAPYFCHIDFLLAKAFERGLVRPTALSEGDDRCAFRYKKGRETVAGWPPEFMRKER